ncbi:MAG: cell division protein FtsX [Paracoccaceae bacterium]
MGGPLQALLGDRSADRVVPPSGHTAWLTLFTAAAMAFLAVFALALTTASGRLAARWEETLSQSATIRISAPADQLAAQTSAVLGILESTPGVASSRALTPEETRALLTPWFGPDMPVETLPVPQLVDVTETAEGFDAEGLRMRLSAEAPGAILDDHSRWRRPLAQAAARLRLLGVSSIILIGLTVAAMIALAAQASLSANAQVIRVLRLVGARDVFIARAFVRRFTLRALWGAMAGTGLGLLAVLLLPSADTAGGFLTGLGFQGRGWLLPLIVPPVAALVAFGATRLAAMRVLRKVT